LALRRVVLLALLLQGAACATLPPCPERGGPAWTEWTAPHVVLLTDLDQADALATLRDLEQRSRAVLLAAWRRLPEPRQRVTVVAFRSEAERTVFVPPEFDAEIFAGAGPLFLVVSEGLRNETLTRGLVRMLSFQMGLGGKVPWFDEGLARYLARMEVERDGTLRYGDVDRRLFSNVTIHGRLTPFEKLWTAPTPATRASFVATSWLAVHYLFNHETVRFLEFQRALFTSGDVRAAWHQAFPDLDFAAMDARLDHYAFLSGTFAAFETRLPAVAAEATATPLADSQLHALRALLFAVPRRRIDLARAEIAEARRSDPDQVTAAFVEREILKDAADDVELPKRLVARHPSDPVAWLLLARARARRHEDDEARESWEEVRRFGGEPDKPQPIELRVARPD
jgi:hypothetical protein